MTRKKVAVLFGGPSSEHEVSRRSAANVLTHVDRERYEVVEVLIGLDGLFEIGTDRFAGASAVETLRALGIEAVFPVLHGAFGEDGQLQRLLEAAGVPFVGSSAAASALAMDKSRAGETLDAAGLRVPRSVTVTLDAPGVGLQFPIILKPVDEGSSVGLSRFDVPEAYAVGAAEAFGSRGRMLAQEFVVGREFTCAVLEVGGEPVALPPSEIILTAGPLFDYEAKYTPNACREVTPAEIDEATTRRIQAAALRCHEALGCRSVSRTDLILDGAGELWVLETNTLPGITETSFLPQQAAAAGIAMPQLVTVLIESARL